MPHRARSAPRTGLTRWTRVQKVSRCWSIPLMTGGGAGNSVRTAIASFGGGPSQVLPTFRDRAAQDALLQRLDLSLLQRNNRPLIIRRRCWLRGLMSGPLAVQDALHGGTHVLHRGQAVSLMRQDPVAMAHAMRQALNAGYWAARSGRIPEKTLRKCLLTDHWIDCSD